LPMWFLQNQTVLVLHYNAAHTLHPEIRLKLIPTMIKAGLNTGVSNPEFDLLGATF